ncbi:hypothetical protein H8959_002299 [Pygathrix nigripes]
MGTQQVDWQQQGLQQLDWQQDDPQPEEQQQGLQQLHWEQPQEPQPPLEPPQEPQLGQEQAGTKQHMGLQQQTGTQQPEPEPPQLESQPPEQPQQPMVQLLEVCLDCFTLAMLTFSGSKYELFLLRLFPCGIHTGRKNRSNAGSPQEEVQPPQGLRLCPRS